MKTFGCGVINIGLVLVLSAGIPALGQSSKTVSELNQTEYAVFSSYIDHSFTGKTGEERTGGSISNIVIADTTVSDQDDPDPELPWKKVRDYLRKKVPTLAVSTIQNFRDASPRHAHLKEQFHLSVPYKLVSAENIHSLIKVGWWPEYYKKYPDSQGILTLSRVGFSADGKQALFYTSNTCGGKCATTTYVVMKKRNVGWVIVKEILMSIS